MRSTFLWDIIRDGYIFIIIAWLVIAIILENHRLHRKFLIFSAVMYVAVLLYVTLLGRAASTEYQMELSFLWEYRLAFDGSLYWFSQILDNILLFGPMGWIYGSLKKDACWWKAAGFGCAVSLMIELCQLVFKLGLFEFDDILNNMIGMMVGYGLYRICSIDRSMRV